MHMAYLYFNDKNYTKALSMCLLAHQPPPKSDMFLEHDKYKDEPLLMIEKLKRLL